jgi:hypothetical protein
MSLFLDDSIDSRILNHLVITRRAGIGAVRSLRLWTTYMKIL